jgi:hypothetical protein
MVITREDDFVSRATGEWRNSSERVWPLSANRIQYFVSLLDKLKLTFEIDVLKLLLCILDTIALNFVIQLHKPPSCYDICSEF